MTPQYISIRSMRQMAVCQRDNHSKWGDGSRLYYCAVASKVAMHEDLERAIARRRVEPMYPGRYFIVGG